MKLSDRIFLLPYLIVFFIDLAVLVIFAGYLFSGRFQVTKVLYFVLVIIVSLVIYFLRIKVIGNKTILNKFSDDQQFGYGLIFFVSMALGCLFITWFIIKTHLNIFFADFQKLDFSPVQWLDFLHENYQAISFHVIIVIVIAYFLFLLTSPLLRKRERTDLIIWLGTIAVVGLLFTFIPTMKVWQQLVAAKGVGDILSFIFGSSLIYFNLLFLLKKPKDNFIS